MIILSKCNGLFLALALVSMASQIMAGEDLATATQQAATALNHFVFDFHTRAIAKASDDAFLSQFTEPKNQNPSAILASQSFKSKMAPLKPFPVGIGTEIIDIKLKLEDAQYKNNIFEILEKTKTLKVLIATHPDLLLADKNQTLEHVNELEKLAQERIPDLQ